MTPQNDGTAPAESIRLGAWGPAILVVALLLPFVNKAFNVDDPLFVWAADHIRREPTRPYMFPVNWFGTDQPMWSNAQNPPLQSYYLALARACLGSSEAAAHLAMLLPTLVCVLAVYDLARQTGANPVATAVGTLATPVFLLSASTVMCDVTMLAFWCAACTCWLRGIERSRHTWLAAAGVCAGLAGWTKYFGMTLVPLLLLHGLVRRRSVGAWAVWLSVPVGMYVAWSLWSQQLFGVSHTLQAMQYAQSLRIRLSPARNQLLEDFLPALSFTGGGLMTPILLGWVVPYRGKALCFALMLVAVVLAFGPRLDASEWKGSPGVLQRCEYAVFILGGAYCLALAMFHVLHRRDADALLVGAWVVGTFIFAAFFNWTVAGRTVLPVAPAVALLLARDGRAGFGWRCFSNVRFYLPTAVTIALGLLLVWVDSQWAAASRVAARELCDKYNDRGGQLWFMGHWGLQYYLEQHGARIVQLPEARITGDDRLLLPRNSPGVAPTVPGTAILVEQREYWHPPFVAVMKHEVGAGFYSSVWGPLPFSFGKVQPEKYEVLAPKL